MWENFGEQIYENIIASDRYLVYLEGLWYTLRGTFGAALIGILLGTMIAIIKVYANNSRGLSFIARLFLRLLSWICDIYLTVIRGTPVMLQLLIIFYGVLVLPLDMSIYVLILGLGLNSGAYVAEIVRSGIQAVNAGQMEAGRSLGLSNNQTMILIILPQAVKNILPALCNEAIMLLKETAIAAYISGRDLTYWANLIRGNTYSIVPLLFSALIYLVVVMIMTFLMHRLERRLARSDKRS